MDRAAWRRVKFMKVSIVDFGLHYDGTLEFLHTIVEHLEAMPRVTHQYGVRLPRDKMTGAPVLARILSNYEKTSVDG